MEDRRDEPSSASSDTDLLAAVMHTSVAAITVLNARGQIVFANDQAEKILGLHRDELMTRRYDAPEWKATALDGGPWPDEEQPFTIVMRTGAPVYDVRHAIEWPNGQRKLLSINGAPIRDASGEIFRLVFSITDITQTIRTDRVLRRIVESTAATGRAYLESIVRALAESLHVRHAHVAELMRGTHERVRTAAVWSNGALAQDFEYDLAGTPCERVVTHGLCFHREAVVSKFPRDAMLRAMNAESYLGVPLRSSSGEVLGLIVVVDGARLDETLQPEAILRIFAGKVAAEIQRKRAEEERRALEEQLFQAQKMESVGRLAGGVAHDFNNLLTAILCYAELCLKRAPRDEALQDYLQQVIDAANRGARLTGQLLAFARKQIIAPKVLDLNELVAGSLDMLRRLLGEDVDVSWIFAEDIGCVRADRGQIEQILMNLAVNARDAMPDGGRLTIETCWSSRTTARCAPWRARSCARSATTS